MSEMKTIEVALTEAEYEETLRLAAARGMTGEQLVRQALRIYTGEEAARVEAAREFGEIIASVQEDAVREGLHMTMEEINEEIAAARREQRLLAKTA